MKCLEPYTVEMIKEMSDEEIRVLWDKIVKEKQTEIARHQIYEEFHIMNKEKINILN